jgi:Rrf2 family nitric oxide-sensitive transcriptional repressor
MRLTNYTDYSLRVLIYLAVNKQEHLVKIQEIADTYHISKNHLMKVVHQLGKIGYLENVRGRNGGLKLAKSPIDINIGEVVRQTEDDFHMVECFDPNKNACALAPACTLKGVLKQATQAYLNVLYGYTLEDLIHNSDSLRELLNLHSYKVGE